ncbi:MAG: 4Fe-4S binding protein, partial [Candidatus Saganbacteria bacterium]|nr:4Fe-4S binding protein [Candidatus Saganbacteria bacterium]
MNIKLSQWIMVWLLPVLVIVGWFYPVLGYLVLGMIVFFSILSFFKQRYWCWCLCSRGAFLQIVMPFFSRKANPPKFFGKAWFRWLVFVLLIGYLIAMLVRAGANPIAIGAVFISMCTLTTLFGILLGTFIKPRTWCTICPMG